MNKKGFTLVEILIVMVVAGILLALILPNTLKAIERSNVVAHENNLRAIQSAIFLCFSEERNWDSCTDIAALVTDGYLGEDPIHPWLGESGGYEIQPDETTGGYIACNSASIPSDVKNVTRGCLFIRDEE